MALNAAEKTAIRSALPNSGHSIIREIDGKAEVPASPNAYTQTYSTVNRTVADPTATAPVTLTDSTGYSGTHDDTLAATTIPTITATNPAAPAAYSAHASGAIPVTSNAATDLDTTAAALAALRASVATYELAISALVVDVAAILSVLVVMAQNQSDVAQKVIELRTSVNALVADDLDNRQSVGAVIDDLQSSGIVT